MGIFLSHQAEGKWFHSVKHFLDFCWLFWKLAYFENEPWIWTHPKTSKKNSQTYRSWKASLQNGCLSKSNEFCSTINDLVIRWGCLLVVCAQRFRRKWRSLWRWCFHPPTFLGIQSTPGPCCTLDTQCPRDLLMVVSECPWSVWGLSWIMKLSSGSILLL